MGGDSVDYTHFAKDFQSATLDEYFANLRRGSLFKEKRNVMKSWQNTLQRQDCSRINLKFTTEGVDIASDDSFNTDSDFDAISEESYSQSASFDRVQSKQNISGG